MKLRFLFVGFLLLAATLYLVAGPGTVSAADDQSQNSGDPGQGDYAIDGTVINWSGGWCLQPVISRMIEDEVPLDKNSLWNCSVAGSCDYPWNRDQYQAETYGEIYFIRTCFHIFYEDDGSNPTADTADIMGQLQRLNEDFWPGRIQFELVGIYHHNSSLYRGLLQSEDFAMKINYGVSQTTTLNIYVVHIDEPYVLGWSYLPWQYASSPTRYGVVCDEFAFGYNDGTCTHEVGHSLGCHHTFHGGTGCDGSGSSEVTECGPCWESAGTESDSTGDFCADTRPTSCNFACSDPGDNDICGSHLPWTNTSFHNYMGYAPSYCQSEFSTSQYSRMRCWTTDKLSTYKIPDVDADGILNASDNCPTTYNPGQEDVDGDTVGNACDNCLNTPNRDQLDTDADGIGDVCDDCTDTDDDGYGNPGFPFNTCDDDNCPDTYNPTQVDDDSDLVGNACDNCPNDYNPGQEDEWPGGGGDVCDGYVHIYPQTLPDTIYLSEYFEYDFQAVGATQPYTWYLHGGDLPFGLAFTSGTDQGKLSGTPSYNATYYFRIRVEAASGVKDTTANLTMVVVDAPEPPYVCGDADGNEIVNIADAVYLIGYIFGGGSPPDPLEAGDADCNTIVNIADAVYLIGYIFGGGPAPCASCP